MNTLAIFLMQTRGAALVEILLLLIVAGLIGYLTSYFYYKSIYTRKITQLEGEKADLQNQINNLQQQVTKLETLVKEKMDELNQ